jgi:hypothetical protein
MDYFTIFFLAYFGIYLVMAVPRQMLTVMGFFFRDALARLVVSLFILMVYAFFTPDEPVAEVEIPRLDLSDIMIDDMRDHSVTMDFTEPVFILPTEE